jgi:hypothetical protein
VTSPALRLRRAIETFHAACYFAPEVIQPYRDAGLHPWNAYFAQRAAPLGAVSAATVIATFYNFNPRLVERSIPSVWEHISPERATELRIEGTVTAIRRLVPDLPDAARLTELGDVTRSAIEKLEYAGRPLAAAHVAIEPPDDPLAALWWAVTVLREFRGDGHVAVLLTEGVGPIEALITSSGYGDGTIEFYQKNRAWSLEEWEAGVDRCASRGWIDADGALTSAGRDLRNRIEESTDRTMTTAIDSLDGHLEGVIDAIKPISRQIYLNGGVGTGSS